MGFEPAIFGVGFRGMSSALPTEPAKSPDSSKFENRLDTLLRYQH